MNKKRLGERLEPRWLLAADLAVTIDEFTFSEPGDEVTRVIRVHNQGDALAADVFVRSNVADLLENATWRRVHYSQPSLSLNPIAADLIVASNARETLNLPVGLGDVNGDGWADFGISTRAGHFVVFGTAEKNQRQIVFEKDGVSDSVNPQWVTKITGIPDSGGWIWKQTSDLNGDGLADFLAEDSIVYGRADFAELNSLEVAPRSGAPIQLGDINGDGVQDWFYYDRRIRGSVIELGNVEGNPHRMRVVGGSLPHRVGDINHDGIDDFGIDRQILLGNERFTTQAILDFDKEPERIPVQARKYRGVGDINADGVDDLLLWDDFSSRLIWGTPSIAEQTLALHSDVGLDIRASIIELSNIGDINNDGFDDFAARDYESMFAPSGSAVAVVLGGPQERSFTVPLGVGGPADRSVSINSADVNGDGILDLVVFAAGEKCWGCSSPELSGGAAIVFGGADIASAPEVTADVTFRVPIGFGASNQGETKDVNHDGIADLLIGSSVIYGSPQLQSHDFGDFVRKKSPEGTAYPTRFQRPLPVEQGYVLYSDGFWQHLDGNADVDVVRRNRQIEVFLNVELPVPSTSEPVLGSGHINDTVDIAAGEQIVYEVVGQLKSDAVDELFATTSLTNASDRPMDNVFPGDRAAAQLDVELQVNGETLSNIGVSSEDRLVVMTATVTNRGPQPAAVVQIEETLGQHLLDARWTVEVDAFPEFSSMIELFGPRIEGSGFGEGLGREVGSLGDIDGDQQADLFAASGSGLRIMESPETWNNQSRSTQIWYYQLPLVRGVGDVDADGFDDFIVASHIVYGGQTFPRDASVGINELRTHLLPWTEDPFHKLVQAGDINGDGFPDWIAGKSLYLGTAEGLFSDDALVGREVQTNRLLYPVGDVNGDGLSDFASQDDNVVVVAFGRETYGDDVFDWSSEPHHTVENVNLQSMCTSCATQIRDVNGDGIGDLIFVGRESERWDVWFIHVVFGSADLVGRRTDFADLNPAHGILLQIDNDDTYLGDYVPRLAVGDYNGDGRADLAIGEGGQVTVVFPRDLQGTVSLKDVKAGVQGKVFQLAYPHRLPVAVASTLDVTGDGIEDFVVGDSPPGAWTEVYPGQIHLVEGRRNFELSGDATASMPELSIPAGGTATVTIQGTLPAGEKLTGRFRVSPEPGLILLNPRDATVYLADRADVNLDGLVDFEDFRILSENFGTVDASRDQGDLDEDGVVGFRDFLILSAEYGKNP